MIFKRIDYDTLNSREKENFNHHKLAALLANYGFNCMRLSNDWHGADFIAVHRDGVTLRVQQKSRLGIDKKYIGKGLHIAFPVGKTWCVVEHDELVRMVGETTNWLNTPSWKDKGIYHSHSPGKALLSRLGGHILNGNSFQ